MTRHKLPRSICADRDCPYLGQATTRSCRCHKTTEQLLAEQRDDMLDTLRAIRDQTNAVQHSQETRLNDIYDIAEAAVVKAGAA